MHEKTNLQSPVIAAIIVGILLGNYSPHLGVAMQPLGDAFIKLIRMVIGPVIFCTVVSGIAGMADMKKVGRVGGKAILYFEIVSTFALVLGLIAAQVLQPGAGFNANLATLDGKSVASFAEKAHGQGPVEFLMHIIPSTVFDAFAQGDILQILLVALLFGSVLAQIGERGKVITDFISGVSHVFFGIVGIVTKLAPIGAFGAMAFTIGKYGLGSLLPLLKLIGTFYLTAVVFVVVVLGAIARTCGAATPKPSIFNVRRRNNRGGLRHFRPSLTAFPLSTVTAIWSYMRPGRQRLSGGNENGATRLRELRCAVGRRRAPNYSAPYLSLTPFYSLISANGGNGDATPTDHRSTRGSNRGSTPANNHNHSRRAAVRNRLAAARNTPAARHRPDKPERSAHRCRHRPRRVPAPSRRTLRQAQRRPTARRASSFGSPK